MCPTKQTRAQEGFERARCTDLRVQQVSVGVGLDDLLVQTGDGVLTEPEHLARIGRGPPWSRILASTPALRFPVGNDLILT